MLVHDKKCHHTRLALVQLLEILEACWVVAHKIRKSWYTRSIDKVIIDINYYVLRFVASSEAVMIMAYVDGCAATATDGFG